MVPQTIQVLPALPIRSSGKIDRDALALTAEPEIVRAYSPPLGRLQSAVADIWARTLGLNRVGSEDNFFDLGGHSLLVVKVQTEIRRELGRDVPVVALFENPTVAAVARYLDSSTTLADDEEARELQQVRRRATRQRLARATRVQAVSGSEDTP
jgi:acyl carrier protein